MKNKEETGKVPLRMTPLPYPVTQQPLPGVRDIERTEISLA